MKNLILTITVALLLSTTWATSQVGINTDAPQKTLDIRGKNDVAGVPGVMDFTDGLVIPRVTTLSAGNQVPGQMVYLTQDYFSVTPGFYISDGAVFSKVGSPSNKTLELLGTVRAKNISQSGAAANQVPNSTFFTVRWETVLKNYMSSLGGTNNTLVTIPAGVSKVRFVVGINYEFAFTLAESTTTLLLTKNNNPFNLANNAHPAYVTFNSKYGTVMTTSFIDVIENDTIAVQLFQTSGGTLDLSWGSVSPSLSVEFYR